MKTSFVSMLAGASALSTQERLGSQLELVIGELQKLHEEYQISLDNTTTTNAAFQTTCSHEQETMEKVISEAKTRSTNMQGQAQTALEGKLNAENAVERAGDQLQREATSQEAGTTQRDAEQKEYTPKSKQCEETISALRNAKNHISAQLSGAFLDMSKIDPKVRSLLQKQDPEDDLDSIDFGDADAGSQSAIKKVNDIVNDLHEDWTKECDEMSQTENTARHNFDMQTQAFRHSKSLLESEVEQQNLVAADQQAQHASANKESEIALAQVESTEAELKESKSECTRVDGEAKARESELRTALSATMTAVDKLSARKDAFVQVVATSLLQLHKILSTDNDVRTRLTDSLMNTAKQFGSNDISNLAMKVKAVGLDKVSQMIKEMITRLQQQANDEKDFEQQCVEAVATLEQDLSVHESQLTAAGNRKEQSEAEIDQLSEILEDTNAALGERNAQNADLTNTLFEAISTLKVDLQDVTDTLAVVADVLQEFEGQLGNPSLAEAAQPVVSVLQVVLTNTQEVQAETQSSLATTEGDLQSEKQDFEVAKTEMETRISQSEQALGREKVDLQDHLTEIENSEALVKSKSEALQTKKTICNGGTREDKHAQRTQAREEEIEQLQQALTILNNQ